MRCLSVTIRMLPRRLRAKSAEAIVRRAWGSWYIATDTAQTQETATVHEEGAGM